MEDKEFPDQTESENKEPTKNTIPAGSDETESEEIKTHRKKSKIKTYKLVLIIIASVLVSLLIIFGALYLFGLRFITYTLPDSTSLKFFGTVNSDGSPRSGHIRYSSGLTASIGDDGTLNYSNGDIYSGDVQYLIKQGTGTYTYSDGDIYVGGFENDMMNGTGTYTYSSGDIYEGQYVDGEKEGTGKYTWANGNVYEGDFLDGKKDGTGTFTFSSGSVYTGGFSNDLKNGAGKFTYASGDSYEGDYVDDMRSGQGTYIWANGDVYVGEFSNNTMNGQGTFTSANGRTFTGYFENGINIRVDDSSDESTETDDTAA